MGLIATSGGETSNSYATTDEADTLLEMIYGCDAWFTLDDDTKEKLLVTASIQIDEMPVKYDSKTTTQAMTFPLNNTSIPEDDGFSNVVKACIWQAYYIYENMDTIKEGEAGAILGVKIESLAPKMQKTASGLNQFRKWSPRTLKLLASYCDFAFTIGRG